MTPKRRFEIAVVLAAIVLGVLYVWWYENNVPWRKRQTHYPIEQPAPTLVPQKYIYYFPITIRPPGLFGHGVAGVPNRGLKADWYYVYGYCSSPCVPMYVAYQYPDFGGETWCASIALFLNEPELAQANGLRPPIDAAWAIEYSHRIRAQCPDTWLISANVSQTPMGKRWLDAYLEGGGEYDQIGFHVYCWDIETCTNHIDTYLRDYPDLSLCMTEWNTAETNDRTALFEPVFTYIHSHLGCSAVFMTCWSCESPQWWSNFDLQTTEGALTEKGKIFNFIQAEQRMNQ